jgi:chromosome segregation ATPase
MADNNSGEVLRLLGNAIKGIEVTRLNVESIKSDIVEIKSDIVEIKSDIVDIKSDILEMKSDIVDLKEGQTKIETEVKVLNKKLSYSSNEMLELRARVEILEEKVLSVN